MTPLIIGDNTIELTTSDPVVRCSITTTQNTRFFSVGSFDTYCTLLDDALNTIATYDDEGPDANFEFQILVPGTYYLDVTLYGGTVSETTTFTLTVEHFLLLSDSQLTLYSRLAGYQYNELLLSSALVTDDELNLYARLTETFDSQLVLSNFLATDVSLNLSCPLVAESRLLLSVRPIDITDNAILFSSPLVNIQDSQLSMTAELLQYRLTDSQLTLSVNLEAEYQSLVIDIHNPETPVYGEYL